MDLRAPFSDDILGSTHIACTFITLGNIGLRNRLLCIRSRVNISIGKGSMIGFDKAMNDRSSYFQLCCM